MRAHPSSSRGLGLPDFQLDRFWLDGKGPWPGRRLRCAILLRLANLPDETILGRRIHILEEGSDVSDSCGN